MGRTRKKGSKRMVTRLVGPSPAFTTESSFMVGNQKKSLRIMMLENKNVSEKTKKRNYVWPRTVEAAEDPFENESGKNKYFFMCAIDLLPVSKIIVPSDSESDEEEEEQIAVENDSDKSDFGLSLCNDQLREDPEKSPVSDSRPRIRRGRRPRVPKRPPNGKSMKHDLSWRTSYNRRTQPARRTRQITQRNRITDKKAYTEVIDSVIERYAQIHNIKLDAPSRAMIDKPLNLSLVKRKTKENYSRNSKIQNNVNESESESDSDSDGEANEAFNVRIRWD